MLELVLSSLLLIMISSKKETCTGVLQRILNTCDLPNFNHSESDILLGCGVLMHCISADAKMSAGVARSIQTRYSVRNQLRHHKLKVGMAVLVRCDDRWIINLVTKERFYEKPTKSTYSAALGAARNILLEHRDNIGDVLDIPPMGMGRDRMPYEWTWYKIIEELNPFVVNIFTEKEPVLPPFLLEGNLPERFSVPERLTTTECCDNIATECGCRIWGATNQSSWSAFRQVFLRRFDYHEGEAKLMKETLISLEDQSCKKGKVIGFSGFQPFMKPRIHFYGDESPHMVRLGFESGRHFWNFLRTRPMLLFSCFEKNVSVEKEVLKPTPKLERPNEKPTVERPTPEVKVVKTRQALRREKKVNMNVSKSTPVKRVDFDKQNFKAAIQQVKKLDAKQIPSVHPPESMKIKYAEEEICHSRMTDLAIDESIMNKHGNITRKTYNLDRVMMWSQNVDNLIRCFYEMLVKFRNKNEAIKAVYRRWTFSEVGSRTDWYRMALVFRKEGMPNIVPYLINNRVVDPFSRRHMGTGKEILENMIGKHSITDFNNHKLNNYVRYIVGYLAFRTEIRRKMGMRPMNVELSPSLLINTYLDSSTYLNILEEPVQETAGWREISTAAKNVSKLDVKEINSCVKDIQHTMKHADITMDYLKDKVNALDIDGLNKVTNNMNSMMDTCNGLMNVLTAPLFGQAIDYMMNMLKVPSVYIEKIKPHFTPVNVAFLTGAYLLFKHTDSLLIKTTAVISVLYKFGLFTTMSDALGKFATGFMKWFRSDSQPIETAGVTSLFSFVQALVSGGGSLLSGFIAGFACLFGVASVTARSMRFLLAKVGMIGRDINFSYLGLANMPKLFTQLMSAFFAVKCWLLGGEKPQTPLDAWTKRVDRWRILLHVLEAPRINDLLRMNEKARVYVDQLYDSGIKILQDGAELNARPAIMEMTRLMTRAKTLADNVHHYRSYSSKRITPYSICLTAKAGVGKTNMIHIIKHIFHTYVYTDIDPDGLVYNVPLDGDHMDGYTKQKIMICDDYNLIDDPSWVAKMAPLVSNVPRVLPMANLSDKGIVQESEVIIKTTNNAYLIPNGVTHSAATLRRNHLVVEVKVPAWSQVNGNLDKDAIIEHEYQVQLKKGASEEDARFAAELYYREFGYYTFDIKNPMVDRTEKTMGAKEFFTLIVKGFSEHRVQQQTLLETNATFPINDDEIRSLTAYKQMIEHMRQNITANVEELKKIFDEESTVPIDEGALLECYQILRVRSAEWRKKILDEPTSFLKNQYLHLTDVLSCLRLSKFFETRMSSNIDELVDRVVEGVTRDLPSGDPLEGETINPETDPIPGEGEEEATPTMYAAVRGMFGTSTRSTVSDTEDYVSTTSESSSSSSEDEDIIPQPISRDPSGHYTVFNAGDKIHLRLEMLAIRDTMQIDEEDDNGMEPSFGWLSQTLFPYVSRADGGEWLMTSPRGARIQERRIAVPMVLRIATDFLMRLRCNTRRPYIDDEDPNCHQLEPQNIWYLEYAGDNAGVGMSSYEREQPWFKESALAFSMLSEEARFDLMDLAYTMSHVYLDLEQVVNRVIFIERPIQEARESIWRRIAAGVGIRILVHVLIMFCIVVYLAVLSTLAWILSGPNPTATKYLVEPRKNVPTKLSWTPTASLEQVNNVRRRLDDNLQLIARPGKNGDFVAQCFFVHGTYAIVPKHFFYDIDTASSWEVRVTSPEFPDLLYCQQQFLDKRSIYEFPDRDAVFVNLDCSSRYFRSALKHFITEKDCGRLVGGKIKIYQRDLDSMHIMGTSTTVRGFSDITLPSLSGTVKQCVYNGSVEVGCSGGPVFFVNDDCPRTLCGIQSATARTWGCFAPLTQETIQTAIENLKVPKFEEFELDEPIYETNRRERLAEENIFRTPANEIFTNTIVLGIQKPENTPTLMAKTSFVRTPIADLLPEVHREPAILCDTDRRRADFVGKPHYLHKSCNKYCMGVMSDIPNSEADAIVEGISEYLESTGEFDNLETLSLLTAVTAEGLDSNSLDLTTSPGLPWSLRKRAKPGKRDWIERDEEGQISYISEEIEDASMILLGKCRSNIVPFYIQNDFMKDELRDSLLGKHNVVRTVTVLPLHVTLVGRQLVLDFHSRLHKLAKQAEPVSVGINIESRSSQLMLQRICSVSGGRNCFDIDASNWDGHFAQWMARCVVRIKNALYSKGKKFKEEDNIARWCWYLAMFTGCIQIEKFVYKKYRGMSSGSCGTAEDNSLGHFCLAYRIWRRLCRKNGRSDLLSIVCFMYYVVFYFYGDDGIFSVHDDVVEWFNGVTVANEYRDLGWKVTPATKGNDIVPSVHWSELVFLKRRFVMDDSFGIVLTPLDLKTIRSLLSWQRGKSLDLFYSNLDDVFRFLVHHGRECFDKTRKEVNLALKHVHLRPVFYRYDDLKESFVSSYDKTG